MTMRQMTRAIDILLRFWFDVSAKQRAGRGADLRVVAAWSKLASSGNSTSTLTLGVVLSGRADPFLLHVLLMAQNKNRDVREAFRDAMVTSMQTPYHSTSNVMRRRYKRCVNALSRFFPHDPAIAFLILRDPALREECNVSVMKVLPANLLAPCYNCATFREAARLVEEREDDAFEFLLTNPTLKAEDVDDCIQVIGAAICGDARTARHLSVLIEQVNVPLARLARLPAASWIAFSRTEFAAFDALWRETHTDASSWIRILTGFAQSDDGPAVLRLHQVQRGVFAWLPNERAFLRTQLVTSPITEVALWAHTIP